LLSSLDLKVQVLQPAGSPVWFALARRRIGDGWTTFTGAGFCGADAVRRCLGELAESDARRFRPSDPHLVCPAAALDGPVIEPNDLLGFDAAQLAARDVLNVAWRGYDAVPPAWRRDDRQAWCAVAGLGGAERAFAPLFLCYAQGPRIGADDG